MILTIFVGVFRKPSNLIESTFNGSLKTKNKDIIIRG
jgi:hypothetical protein